MPRALLSVSDKNGIVDLAQGLAARGFELVSTGGTARTLQAAGLAVTSVSDVTGFPEMMDGRVKTLHPHIHGGILARRDHPDDLHAIAQLGIVSIDVVVVNLYPFRDTAKRSDVTFDELVEQIDIGGPSLLRAAAKNFRDVLVVVNPDEYGAVLKAIDEGPTREFRYRLMVEAFAHTAEYDGTIAATMLQANETLSGVARDATESYYRPTLEFGDRADLMLTKIRDLRYGENPHQQAAWYAPAGDAWGFGRATVVQGRELSYTNLLDLDAAARIAREADSVAAYGGIVALNRAIDAAAAAAIVATFIEAVVAPSIEPAAREVLARKANMRVVTADLIGALDAGVEMRSILGAMLLQQRDRVAEARTPWTAGAVPDDIRVVTKRQPTAAEWDELRFAWRVCAHVKSNAVIFTDATRTLAIGAGQMSRVDAVNVATMKARESA